VPVSFYDNSAFKATSIYTATQTNAQAFAYPYEGYALGVAILKSTTGSSQSTATSTSSPSQSSTAPSSAASSHGKNRLSGGAKAGIAIAAIVGVALLLLAGFLIFRHRRKKLAERQSYNVPSMIHDPNAPGAGYYNTEPKKDLPPDELYGSQDVKNHGETQELDSTRTVYEMGDRSDYAASTRSRDRRVPSLPSPLSSTTNTASSRGILSPHSRM
jgi:hypothetical protein